MSAGIHALIFFDTPSVVVSVAHVIANISFACIWGALGELRLTSLTACFITSTSNHAFNTFAVIAAHLGIVVLATGNTGVVDKLLFFHRQANQIIVIFAMHSTFFALKVTISAYLIILHLKFGFHLQSISVLSAQCVDLDRYKSENHYQKLDIPH